MAGALSSDEIARQQALAAFYQRRSENLRIDHGQGYMKPEAAAAPPQQQPQTQAGWFQQLMDALTPKQ